MNEKKNNLGGKYTDFMVYNQQHNKKKNMIHN